MKKLLGIVMGAALVLGLAGAGVLAGAVLPVNAAAATMQELQGALLAETGPGLLGAGYLGECGRWGGEGRIDHAQLLADALGITVAALQEAYETARVAAIDQALEAGVITQEQADRLLVWGGVGRRGPAFHFGKLPPNVPGARVINEGALLAEALGITAAELESAREQAAEAALEEALAEGWITEEEVEAMRSRQALRGYLEHDVLLAEVLGMSVAALREAYAAGENLTTLMEARGLDALSVREGLQAAREAAIEQAVTDGVITQEQANELLDRPFGGPMFGNRGPGMRGRRHQQDLGRPMGHRGSSRGGNGF